MRGLNGLEYINLNLEQKVMYFNHRLKSESVSLTLALGSQLSCFLGNLYMTLSVVFI